MELESMCPFTVLLLLDPLPGHLCDKCFLVAGLRCTAHRQTVGNNTNSRLHYEMDIWTWEC